MTSKVQGFISRKLSVDSPLLRLPIDWQDVSLIDIDYTTISFPSTNYNWLFFYSKNGVKAYHALFGNDKRHKWATIGESTAQCAEDLGITIDFRGNGLPEDVATSFLKVVGSKDQVLFLRAKESRNSIQRIIEEHIMCDSEIIYCNKIRATLPHFNKHYKIGVFTSPMNAKAFFQDYSGDLDCIIAIGKTTYKTIKRYTSKSISIPSSPSESSIYTLIFNIFENNK